MKLILNNTKLEFGVFNTTKYTYVATTTGDITEVFGSRVSNKKGMFRLSSPDGAEGGLSMNQGLWAGTLDTIVPIFLNYDFTGKNPYNTLNVRSTGTFVLEFIDFYSVPNSDIVTNYGAGCYMNSTHNIPAYSSASWAASNILSEMIPTSRKVQFVSAAVGKNVDIEKWDANGDWVEETTSYTIPSGKVNLSIFEGASYIRIQGTTTAFPDTTMFTSVE